MTKSHERALKFAIREQTELSLFHARRAQALQKELKHWKAQQIINVKLREGVFVRNHPKGGK